MIRRCLPPAALFCFTACGGPGAPPVQDVCDVGEVALSALDVSCRTQALSIPSLTERPCGATVETADTADELKFDGQGNLIVEDGFRFEYRDDGQLLAATRGEGETEQRIDLEYTDDTMAFARITGGRQVSYGYNLEGLLNREIVGNGGQLHHYDTSSGLRTHTTTFDGREVVRYTYASDGLRSSAQYLNADGITLDKTYFYDAYQRLARVTIRDFDDDRTSDHYYRYDEAGRLVSEDVNLDDDGAFERRTKFSFSCE